MDDFITDVGLACMILRCRKNLLNSPNAVNLLVHLDDWATLEISLSQIKHFLGKREDNGTLFVGRKISILFRGHRQE